MRLPLLLAAAVVHERGHLTVEVMAFPAAW